MLGQGSVPKSDLTPKKCLATTASQIGNRDLIKRCQPAATRICQATRVRKNVTLMTYQKVLVKKRVSPQQSLLNQLIKLR